MGKCDNDGRAPSQGGQKLISIVVPTHNEERNVALLCSRLADVFAGLPRYTWELIFVDDSTDLTPQLIASRAKEDPRIKLVQLVRSFGQATAIVAGLERAQGQAVVMMDCDLQDPPETIPGLLEKWSEGYKVVYVQRNGRSRSALYKVLAKTFYRILALISDVEIPIDTGEFRLIDRVVVDFMNTLSERTRFIRGLTLWPGFKSAKINIVRDERAHGETNYNLARSFGVAIDGFVSFSIAPLRLATFLGIAAASCSLLLSIAYFILWIFDRSLFGAGWMSLFLSIMFMGGLNLFCVGIVGEYVGRVFMEQLKRPLYLVEQEIGIGDRDPLSRPEEATQIRKSDGSRIDLVSPDQRAT